MHEILIESATVDSVEDAGMGDGSVAAVIEVTVADIGPVTVHVDVSGQPADVLAAAVALGADAASMRHTARAFRLQQARAFLESLGQGDLFEET